MKSLARSCVMFALVVSLPGQALMPPSRTLTIPNVYLANAKVFWSHGYTIYAADEGGSVSVYDTKGTNPNVVLQSRLLPDGATSLLITDATASPSGNVFAASGTASASNGPITGLLAFFGPGRTPLLVQLPNTGLFRVVFADDGTVWAMVRQTDSSFEELGDYNIMRHYDANGKYLGSAIPRSTFIGKRPPMYTPSLSSSKDTIGIFFDRPKLWVEMSYNGSVKGQWTVPAVPLAQGQTLPISYVYWSDSGRVIRLSWTSGPQMKDHLPLVEQLVKSNQSLASTPVDLSAVAPFRPYFLGLGGDEVVWLEDSSKLHWSKLP